MEQITMPSSILKQGGSQYLRLPREIQEYLETHEEDIVPLIRTEKTPKDKKYCSFWIKGK